MRKSWAFIALVLSFALIAGPLNAAGAKAGGKCTKAGATSTVGGKKFTCVKSGTKLVWNKGVSVKAAAKPAINPVLKPAEPTPVATPTPSAPANPKAPTSFDDLFGNRRGIAYSVWSQINKKTSVTNTQLPTIEIYRGPNTPTYIADPSIYLRQVAQLFANFSLPKKVVIFYWTIQDVDSVATKALSIMGKENYQKNYDETTGPFVGCNTQNSCDVGHALIGIDGTAYLGIGLPDTLLEAQRSGGGYGGVEKVEFYHALQLFNYHINSLTLKAGGQNIQSSYLPPTWLNIGGENLVSVGLKYIDDNWGFSQSVRYKSWTNEVVPNFSLDWLNNYLNISNLGKDWSDAGFKTVANNVFMGSYLTEIFVSIKGPDVLLLFHEQMSKKKSFTEAFESIFGTTWQKAEPEIAKTIYDRYLNNY